MVREIIPKYPESDRAELIEAANSFRFPFWDWASKKLNDAGEANYDVPKIVRHEEVEVRGPEGSLKIPNPFWQFKMPNNMAMGDPQLQKNAITREPVRSIHFSVPQSLINRSIIVPREPVVMSMMMMLRKTLLTFRNIK